MSYTLSLSDKLAFFSSMSSMLSSGIPLLETLETLQIKANTRQKVILGSLAEDIAQGKTLFQALEKFPNVFEPTLLSVVKGAEESGTLEETLQDVVKNVEQQMEFEEKVKEALTYPAFIFLVFIGVILLLLLFVIPRIADIFERLRVSIPRSTQLIISFSDFIINYPIPILLSIFILIAGGWYLSRRYRRQSIRFLFSLPIISRLGNTIDLARFFRSFSLLLAAGIPITESVELASQGVNQKKLYELFSHAQQVVEAGNPFSDALTKSETISPLTIRMIAAGEKSGSLEKASQNVSELYEKDVKKNLKRLTVLLEPIMILCIGVLIGGMMLSIIAPIYGLIGQIGG